MFTLCKTSKNKIARKNLRAQGILFQSINLQNSCRLQIVHHHPSVVCWMLKVLKLSVQWVAFFTEATRPSETIFEGCKRPFRFNVQWKHRRVEKLIVISYVFSHRLTGHGSATEARLGDARWGEGRWDTTAVQSSKYPRWSRVLISSGSMTLRFSRLGETHLNTRNRFEQKRRKGNENARRTLTDRTR